MNSKLEENIMHNLNKGWACPKCGSCYSPIVIECDKCKNSEIDYSKKKRKFCDKCNMWVYLPHRAHFVCLSDKN